MCLQVGGLPSDGSSLEYCNNKLWNSFDVVKIYKSCLSGPHLYVQGEFTTGRSLSIENRLLHYLVAYILVYQNTNHAQPTINDHKLMFAIREHIIVNRTVEILKVMYEISNSSSRLIAYGIFISRVIDYLDIDTSYT
ncbi:unnamed protein product [Lupinus luteus]|uniref:Uncharacterized protein n=1 Tax=Lupinus luteus TaxID=3873 RepID=A0AAV1XCF6_LUPLU